MYIIAALVKKEEKILFVEAGTRDKISYRRGKCPEFTFHLRLLFKSKIASTLFCRGRGLERKCFFPFEIWLLELAD